MIGIEDSCKVFYPLGVISPTTLKAKLLFQELCLLKLSWDEKTTKIIVDNDSSDKAETDAEVRVRPEVRDRPGGRDRPPRRSAALNAEIF